MRRDAKVDGNHADVAKALRAAGWSVISLAPLGCGIPDLAASKGLETWLLEVKNPKAPPNKRKPRPEQLAFAASWQGKYAVVESAEQALALISA